MASTTDVPSDGSSIWLLQPGQMIKPALDKSGVPDLVKRLYGLRVTDVVEFKGYDDKNFFVQVEGDFSNPYIHQLSPDGYVLKVINSLNSKTPHVIDAQTELMLYVQNQGFVVNTPIKNVAGNYKSLEKIGVDDKEHLVRLLSFLPGDILNEVRCTSKMCRQVGLLAARFDVAIEAFHHSVYDTYDSIWMLSRAPEVRKFVDAVNEERQQMVNSVLDKFETEVLKNMDKLPTGMIHGDLNEHNLVVRKMSSDEYEVYGILDFGDTQRNCFIFEVALATIYCILLGSEPAEWLDFGGHVVAGYSTVRPLSSLEWDVLKICMEARLCQSLIMGAYTHRQDPSNDYVLTTAKTGWNVLKWLTDISKEDLYDKWQAMEH